MLVAGGEPGVVASQKPTEVCPKRRVISSSTYLEEVRRPEYNFLDLAVKSSSMNGISMS